MAFVSDVHGGYELQVSDVSGIGVIGWAAATAGHGVVNGVAAAIAVPIVGFGGGFVFGVGRSIASDVLIVIGMNPFGPRLVPLAKLVVLVFNFTLATLAGWALAVACGVELTFTAAIGISLVSIALIALVIGVIAAVVLCCVCCAGGLGEMPR